MVTQVEVAKAVGLDVSSVNKILTGKHGPVFRKETRKLVLSTAKKMGYARPKGSKSRVLEALRELFPVEQESAILAARFGITPTRADEIKEVIRAAE